MYITLLNINVDALLLIRSIGDLAPEQACKIQIRLRNCKYVHNNFTSVVQVPTWTNHSWL